MHKIVNVGRLWLVFALIFGFSALASAAQQAQG